jgi:hypothetical protein
MVQSTYIDDQAIKLINHALQAGDTEQAFTLLAKYLLGNGFTLSDEVFRLFLENGLFACLKDRGEDFRKY